VGSGTVGDLDETILRRLYATVPSEFVAARNEVVKELRRAKERDEATLVAAMRRPDWTDWALNVAAAERTDVVAAFATAAGEVRDAQTAAIEGRAGPDIRTALRTLRDRTADLIREAAVVLDRAGRAPGTAELTARLSEIAANAAAIDQMRTGVLGSGDPDVSDPFAGLEPAALPRQRRDAPSKRTAATVGREDQPAIASGRASSAAERQRIKRDRDRAEQVHKTAVRDLAGAETELEKATAAVANARNELADAERRQEEATRRRLAAAEKLTNTESALEALDSNPEQV
jgi:hypothetical protein